jgi:hypothetical protein
VRAVLVTIAVVTSGTITGGQVPGELVDRTLAIVGGQAITLSDVRAALALGLLDDLTPDADVRAATERLIERTLILREVQRYAPAEPSHEAIEAGVASIAARFADAEALATAMASVAFSDRHLRAWVRDGLRITAYIDQRFAAAESPERRMELVRDWISDIRRRTPVVELIKPQARQTGVVPAPAANAIIT